MTGTSRVSEWRPRIFTQSSPRSLRALCERERQSRLCTRLQPFFARLCERSQSSLGSESTRFWSPNRVDGFGSGQFTGCWGCFVQSDSWMFKLYPWPSGLIAARFRVFASTDLSQVACLIPRPTSDRSGAPASDLRGGRWARHHLTPSWGYSKWNATSW